jgi:hypothetical protein
MPAHRVANSCCTPGRCLATLMTATRWAQPLRGSPAARSSVPISRRDTAARCRKRASHLHLRPNPRALRHQTRAQTALRDRGGDRTYKGRRSSRRCYLKGRAGDAANVTRLQAAPRSRLAEDHFAHPPPRAIRNSASPLTGFLTGDWATAELPTLPTTSRVPYGRTDDRRYQRAY